jgi:hypothetical protein
MKHLPRHGQHHRVLPCTRRASRTTPEFGWIVGPLEHDQFEVRPLFSPGRHPAFWVTERWLGYWFQGAEVDSRTWRVGGRRRDSTGSPDMCWRRRLVARWPTWVRGDSTLVRGMLSFAQMDMSW